MLTYVMVQLIQMSLFHSLNVYVSVRAVHHVRISPDEDDEIDKHVSKTNITYEILSYTGKVWRHRNLLQSLKQVLNIDLILGICFRGCLTNNQF